MKTRVESRDSMKQEEIVTMAGQVDIKYGRMRGLRLMNGQICVTDLLVFHCCILHYYHEVVTP